MADPAVNFALIIASYEPPETDLEPPNTILFPDEEEKEEDIIIPLPVVAKEDGNPIPISFPSPSEREYKSRPVAYTYTQPTNRSAKVTNLDIAPLFSNAGVRGMVTNVCHGTFYSRPATLIVFSFVFRSGDHGFRFKNANIKVTFASNTLGSKSTSNVDAGPSVVKFAPRKVFGLPTIEGKKNSIGGEFSLEVPAGPVTVGPSVSWGKEWEYETSHRFSTVGNFWSSKHGTDWDIVYWDIKENKKTSAGIPDRFNCAVIVERDGNLGGKSPFTATVEVTVDTPMGNGFLSRPWSRERPVAFVEGVEMGRQHVTREFEKLTEDQWRALAPFDAEWESRFTDVALHKQDNSQVQIVPKPLQKAVGVEEEESDDR